MEFTFGKCYALSSLLSNSSFPVYIIGRSGDLIEYTYNNMVFFALVQRNLYGEFIETPFGIYRSCRPLEDKL